MATLEDELRKQKLDLINKIRRSLINKNRLREANQFSKEALPPEGSSFSDLDSWQGHMAYLRKLAKKYDSKNTLH